MKKILMSLIAGQNIPINPTLSDAISFSLRGQSNALGRADASLLTPPYNEVLSNVYILNNGSVQPYRAGEFYINTGQYGVELFLSLKLRDYHNVPVFIDKYAIGGTKLAVDLLAQDWNLSSNELWNTGKLNYTNGIRLSKSYNINPINKFFIWFQGESDGVLESDANAYQVNQQAIFDDLRTFIGDPNYPIIDCLPHDSAGTYSSNVRNAKKAIAAGDPNIHIIDTNILHRIDGTHLSEQGFRDLADLIFDIVKDF